MWQLSGHLPLLFSCLSCVKSENCLPNPRSQMFPILFVLTIMAQSVKMLLCDPTYVWSLEPIIEGANQLPWAVCVVWKVSSYCWAVWYLHITKSIHHWGKSGLLSVWGQLGIKLLEAFMYKVFVWTVFIAQEQMSKSTVSVSHNSSMLISWRNYQAQ